MENKYWRYIAWIILAIIFILIGYGIGYGKGFSEGVKFTIKVGLSFVDIKINQDKLIAYANLYELYCKNKGTRACVIEDFNLTKI